MLNTDVVQSDSVRVARIASTISSNTERLSRLVTNLERLSRLTDSLDMPSQQEVDLHALGAEVVRQVDEMATARDVMIRIEAAAVPPLLVDSARLELVLLNLVSNAINTAIQVSPIDSLRSPRPLPATRCVPWSFATTG